MTAGRTNSERQGPGPYDFPNRFPAILTLGTRLHSSTIDLILAPYELPWASLTLLVTALWAWALSRSLVETSALAALFLVFTKGLNLFQKEKRLDHRASLLKVTGAWIFSVAIGTYFAGVNGALATTGAAITTYLVLAATGIYVRKYKKSFIVIGRQSKISTAICAAILDPRGVLKDFYQISNHHGRDAQDWGTVILADGPLTREMTTFLTNAHLSGVNIVAAREFYQEIFGRVPVFGELDDLRILIDIQSRLPFSELAMRGFDIFIAGVALLLAIPIILIISVLIKLDSEGPIFFLHDRQGKRGLPFKMVKFRTMVEKSSHPNHHFTINADPRVTKVGRTLRHFHLDELPQLINVLRGEMSLVGPRPDVVAFAQKMSEVIPAYNLRYIVRPGMTGLAQLNQGYVLGDVESTLGKMSYDFTYLTKRSLWTDLNILLRTAFFIWNDTSYTQRTQHVDPVDALPPSSEDTASRGSNVA